MRRGLCLVIAAIASLSIAPRAEAIDIQQVTTSRGIKVWLVRDKTAPLVSLSFSFAGGTASEPDSQKGATGLMARMLTDGAGTLPAQAFRLRQEEAAVSLDFGASPDRLNGSLRVLSANRDQGFDLLRLALTAPRFDADMLEQRRSQAIASFNQAEQRPRAVAERTMMRTMFAGHPYARDYQDLRDTLKTIAPSDLRARAAALLRRDGLIVAAVGDVDADGLAQALDRAFGDLPAGEPVAAIPQWTPSYKQHSVAVERPVPQSAIVMAMPGVLRADPDWYAALVLSHILGGGQQSRLFTEVRDKRGLAYSVSSSLRPAAKASLLVISTGSANDRVAETIQVIRREIARLREQGVDDQELDDAKTYLIGALALSLDSSRAVAGLLHGLQVDGLPRDSLDRRTGLIAVVTKADVDRVARRLLRDDATVTVVVGKPQGLVLDR